MIRKGGELKLSKKRILVFDYIRGYLMIVILIDHLNIYPSIFQYITGRGQMWVTAAEGFFFISGAMVGLIRGSQYLKDKDILPIAKKLLNRSWKLYLYYVLFTILSVLIALILIKFNLGTLKTEEVMTAKGISRTFWNIVQLSAGYGYVNFLKYYAIYMILSIPLLWLLKNKMWYLIIGLAVVSWFEPRLATFNFDNLFFYWFSYFALGTLFGFYYNKIKSIFLKKSSLVQQSTSWLCIGVLFLIFGINWYINFFDVKKSTNVIGFLKSFSHYQWKLTDFTETWLYNNRTGVMRLAIFLLIAPGLFFIFKKLESIIKRRLDWIIGEFGRNSLRTFIVGGISVLLFKFWAVDITFIYNSLVSVLYLYLVLKIINISWIKKYISN